MVYLQVHTVLDMCKEFLHILWIFFWFDFIMPTISIFVAGIDLISVILSLVNVLNNLIASYFLGYSVIRFSASDKNVIKGTGYCFLILYVPSFKI